MKKVYHYTRTRTACGLPSVWVNTVENPASSLGTNCCFSVWPLKNSDFIVCVTKIVIETKSDLYKPWSTYVSQKWTGSKCSIKIRPSRARWASCMSPRHTSSSSKTETGPDRSVRWGTSGGRVSSYRSYYFHFYSASFTFFPLKLQTFPPPPEFCGKIKPGVSLVDDIRIFKVLVQ